MAEVTHFAGSDISGIYQGVLSVLPPFIQHFINFFLIVLVILIYSVFIWKFYRFIARKNILGLNLNKYNRTSNPKLAKFVASILYFIENILILPLLVFIWFSVFAIFLILLTEGLEIGSILLVAATIVAAIRMVSYYSHDLSKDIAKLLPFTLLGIAITKAGFFDFNRIVSHFGKIPNYFPEILLYLVFIIIIELVLRVLDVIFSLLGIEDGAEEETFEND